MSPQQVRPRVNRHNSTRAELWARVQELEQQIGAAIDIITDPELDDAARRPLLEQYLDFQEVEPRRKVS